MVLRVANSCVDLEIPYRNNQFIGTPVEGLYWDKDFLVDSYDMKILRSNYLTTRSRNVAITRDESRIRRGWRTDREGGRTSRWVGLPPPPRRPFPPRPDVLRAMCDIASRLPVIQAVSCSPQPQTVANQSYSRPTHTRLPASLVITHWRLALFPNNKPINCLKTRRSLNLSPNLKSSESYYDFAPLAESISDWIFISLFATTPRKG